MTKLNKLSEDDLEQVEKIKEIVSTFQAALFATVEAACSKATRSKYVDKREKANKLWDSLVDDVIEFVMEDE